MGPRSRNKRLTSLPILLQQEPLGPESVGLVLYQVIKQLVLQQTPPEHLLLSFWCLPGDAVSYECGSQTNRPSAVSIDEFAAVDQPVPGDT